MEAIQLIRLADILLIGPYLIYIGSRAGVSRINRYLLIGIGLGTIIYNAYNFIEEQNKT